jgi:hypothetical protein
MVGEAQGWHRRHAIGIAAQLPETPADALIVLELAKSLVEGFLCGRDQAPLERPAVVVAFSAADAKR